MDYLLALSEIEPATMSLNGFFDILVLRLLGGKKESCKDEKD